MLGFLSPPTAHNVQKIILSVSKADEDKVIMVQFF